MYSISMSALENSNAEFGLNPDSALENAETTK
jgi:hypothetical protein